MPPGRKLLGSPGWLLLGVALSVNAQTLATSGRVSTTAESVCTLRDGAARHPDAKIRNPDYLAEKFVVEGLAHLAAPHGCRPGAAQSQLLLGQRADPSHGRPAD